MNRAPDDRSAGREPPARRFTFLTTFYPPHNFGGDGIATRRLATTLARAGYEVRVLYDPGAHAALAGAGGEPPAEAELTDDGVLVHRLRSRGRLELLVDHQLGRPTGRARQIERHLRRHQCDVLHFHNVSLLGGPGVLRHGPAAAVRLCTLHDYWFVCPMHVLWRNGREACDRRTCLTCTLRGHRPPQLWRALGAARRATREVDAFVTGSDAARRLHLEHGFDRPIRVLPHFLPDAELAELETGAEAPAPHPRPYILFVGRLEKLKGLRQLIETLPLLPELDLLVAGAGPEAARLRDLHADRVHWLGSVPRKRLGTLYHHALALVVPSLCYETFGQTVIEAFALGTPVVARAIGALTEIVPRSKGGLVFSRHEEMARQLDALRVRPGLRRRLGTRARRDFLDRYTERRGLTRYLDLIQELTEQRRRTSTGEQ